MTNLNQNGRSMIEMLGVLAIIGVLSVGGIAGYSKAMMKFKTNKTIDQIAMTVTNIRTLYAQQNTYDITDSTAYSMGVVDDAMKGSAESKLKNPFANADSSVFIAPAQSGAVGESGNGAFVIALTGLPREACVAIATNDWGSNYSSGFLGIATQGTAYTNGAAAVTALTSCTVSSTTAQADGLACSNAGPLNVAKAAAGCNCTGENANKCSVALKYY